MMFLLRFNSATVPRCTEIIINSINGICNCRQLGILLLCIAVFSISTPVYAAEWVFIRTLATEDSFADNTSINQENQFVTFSTKMKYTPVYQGFYDAVESHSVHQVDCEKKLMRTLQDGPDIKKDGIIVPARNSDDNKWKATLGGVEKYFDFACRR